MNSRRRLSRTLRGFGPLRRFAKRVDRSHRLAVITSKTSRALRLGLQLALCSSSACFAVDRPVEFSSPHPEIGGRFGGSLAVLEDLTGDGYSEVLVGAPREDGGGVRDAGRAYILNGSTTEVFLELESPDPRINGNFGSAVVGCGDLNGNGSADVIVAALKEDGEGGPEDAGRVYAFDGRTGDLLHRLVSPNAEKEGAFGTSIARIGDLDGDGVEEIIVGAANEIPGPFLGLAGNAGRAYVFSASGFRVGGGAGGRVS